MISAARRWTRLEVPGPERRGACERQARRLQAGELAVDGGDDLLRRGAGLFLVLHLLGPGELPDEDDGEQKHRHQERRAIGHQVLAKRTIALSHHRLERRTLPATLDGGTGHERRQSPPPSWLCARRRSRGRGGPGGAAGGASLELREGSAGRVFSRVKPAASRERQVREGPEPPLAGPTHPARDALGPWPRASAPLALPRLKPRMSAP